MRTSIAATALASEDSSITSTSKRVTKETLARLGEAEATLALLNKEKGDNLRKWLGILMKYMCWNVGLLGYSLIPWICTWSNGVQPDLAMVIIMVLMYVCGWLAVNMMFYMLVRVTKGLVWFTRQVKINHIRSLLNGQDVVIPVEYSAMPLEHFRKRRFEIEHEVEEIFHDKYDEMVILALLSVVAVAVMVLIVHAGSTMTATGATLGAVL